MDLTKARRTLDPKRANDFAPRNYKIVTKIGRSLYSRGAAWKMSNMYLKSLEMYRLVLFWSHTQIEEKTMGSGIMMRMLPIWYNFKMCTDL